MKLRLTEPLRIFIPLAILCLCGNGLFGCGESTPTAKETTPAGGPGSVQHISGSSNTIENLGTTTLAPGTISPPFILSIDPTVSAFLMVADSGRASDIDISLVRDPHGTLLVTQDPSDLDPIGRNTMQSVGGSVASGLFPHTPNYGIQTGNYEFRASNFDTVPRDVRLTAFINRRTNLQSGTLPVNLHFCGIDDLTAATALNHPSLRTLLDEFTRIFQQANIQIAFEGTYECAAGERTRLSVIDGLDSDGNGQLDELDDLFSSNTGVSSPGVSVFFVQQIDDGTTGSTTFLAGISGGIPGPGTLAGTPHSGVAVALVSSQIGTLSQESLLRRGRTMAHEVGHYLGLFHTTERCGANASTCLGLAVPFPQLLVDPIPDTPECSSAADVNNDGAVSADECLASGGLNVMFWTQPVGPQPRDQITSGQTFVLQRNPVVR